MIWLLQSHLLSEESKKEAKRRSKLIDDYAMKKSLWMNTGILLEKWEIK